MSISERVSVAQAAKELGISPGAVRVRMESGMLPIGQVVQGSGKNKSYTIYRNLLDKYLGKKVETVSDTDFRNRLFYATCIFSGILHEIQKEIDSGTDNRLDELHYCVKEYEQQYDVSTSVLYESIERYRKVLMERSA